MTPLSLAGVRSAGVVVPRSPARLSESWRRLLTRRDPVSALRCMSGWRLLAADVAPYLALLARVESQPGCVGALSGQDGARYRRLVAWDVVVAPSVRRATAAGVALVHGHDAVYGALVCPHCNPDEGIEVT